MWHKYMVGPSALPKNLCSIRLKNWREIKSFFATRQKKKRILCRQMLHSSSKFIVFKLRLSFLAAKLSLCLYACLASGWNGQLHLAITALRMPPHNPGYLGNYHLQRVHMSIRLTILPKQGQLSTKGIVTQVGLKPQHPVCTVDCRASTMSLWANFPVFSHKS